MTHPFRPESDKDLNLFKFNKALDAFYALCGIWKAYIISDGLDEDGITIKIKENIDYKISPVDSFHDTYFSEQNKINDVTAGIINRFLDTIQKTDNLEELQYLESLSRRLEFEKPYQEIFIQQNKTILSAIRSRIDALERVGKLQRFFRNGIQWIKDKF